MSRRPPGLKYPGELVATQKPFLVGRASVPAHMSSRQ